MPGPLPTDPARLAEELAHRNDELAALDAIGRIAARSADLDAFLDEGSRIVVEVTRCTAVAVYTHDEAGNAIDLLHQRGLPAEIAARVARAPVEAPAIFSLPPPAVAAGQSAADVISPSVYPPHFRAIFEAAGVRSLARVPLAVGSRIVGVLAVGFSDPQLERPRGHLRFLRAVGALLGAVISSDRLLGSLRRRVSELTLLNDENSRLYVDARRQVAHLESMHALALRVFVHPPGDQVALLRDGCREIAAALDAPTAAAFLVSEDKRTLRCLALHGTAADLERVSLPLDADPLAADAVRLGRAGQTPDSRREPHGAMAQGPDAPSLSLLAVPLGSRDVGRGVVFVGDRAGRTFDDHEVALARAMASALAVGLENAGLEVDLDRSHAALQRTQSQLLQRERLAALGALSAAVAHEVRNPLGVIFNAVGMLRRRKGLDEEGRGLVGIVAEEAERLNRIVTDLLGFARPPMPALRAAPLAPIVEEAVRAALSGIRAPIQVSYEFSPDLPAVAVDAGLVRQAVINVVLNAVQAMARSGRLRIRTARDGEWATIEVDDTGPGIPAELRERIFEPFFTTKTSGTGLGLSIVKHVVEVHGGAIEVTPGPEVGTRFTLRFPLVPTTAAARTTPVAG